MQSKNPGGRPRNDWTSSRRRKLARLYILTPLPITEIQRELGSESFNPSRRDIQSRLHELLSSDYSKFHRDFRPSSDFNMSLRLKVIRRCRKLRLMKSRWRFRPLPERSFQIPPVCKDSVEAFRGHPWPSSSLDSSCNPSGYPHSQIANPNLLMLDGSMIRRKTEFGFAKDEIKTPPAKPSSVQPQVARGLPSTILQNELESKIGEGKPTEDKHSNARGRTKTQPREHYTDSFMEHIASTLSATESRRSSDVSITSVTNSLRSCEFSITKEHTIRNNEFGIPVGFEPEGSALSLSQSEMAIWNDLIDETKCDTKPWFGVPSILSVRYSEVALATRTCCKMPDVGDHNFLCKDCGFTQTHHFAKLSLGRVLRKTEAINQKDYFGNTLLHCAVITGAMNLTGLRYLIDNGAEINARNSFGETFMHLITSIASGEEDDYISLLKLLAGLDFLFTQRDFQGRTILHVLFQQTPLPLLSTKIMHQIQAATKLDMNLRDSRGYTIQRLLELDLGTRSLVTMSSDILLETTPILTELRSVKLDHKSSWVDIWKDSGSPCLLSRLQQLELEDPMNWIDSIGDTILTGLLKLPCWTAAINEDNIIDLVKEMLAARVSIHTRDRNGDTPLAIATKRGLRPILSLLLNSGANPNTRNYEGTSLLVQASLCMHKAGREGEDRLYSTIMSCIALLTDLGAKLGPTQHEEWLYSSTIFC